MAKAANKLAARFVTTVEEPGLYSDGSSLYLNVRKGGSKQWVFIFRWQGKRTEMGIGPSPAITLSRARELAKEAGGLIAEGRNPLEAKRAAATLEAPEIPTFGEMADRYITTHQAAWRNEKHIAQWRMTLREYCASIREKPVDQITTEDVLGVLKPIWQSKAETASRLRGRIEAVLDAAKAQKLRAGENPATWRGNLKHLLPSRSKLTRGHHAAMPYSDVPPFLALLKERPATAALALEFTILTAARSGETLGAVWSEIDLTENVWVIPAARMKAKREHRVPLPPRAVEILAQLSMLRRSQNGNAYVFPGQQEGRPLSNMSMEMLLRRMEVPFTVHGFRSSFRDWAGETSTFPREIAEAALAHVVGDETERAYRRSDALMKRRKMMDAWCKYCSRSTWSNVLPIQPKGKHA